MSTVYFDIEAASADELWSYGPGFVRLSGWRDVGVKASDVGILITTDHKRLIKALEAADVVVGHNILGFDLLALCREYGLDWEYIASKAVDTELAARLADPPMAREGYAAQQKKYNLSAVAKRMGHRGKTDDLARLKRKFGGYDKIPTDDVEYRDYLVGDVEATTHVGRKTKLDDYAKREHRLAIIAGHASLDGIRVDERLIDQRIAEGRATRRQALDVLHRKYGLPLENAKGVEYKSPVATAAGKAALVEAFGKAGAEDLPMTEKTGALDTSKESIQDIREYYKALPDVVEIAELVGTVNGVRTVYDTAKKWTVDGRVHPMVSMRQASGRWSVTKPGMTVFGKKGGKWRERQIFLPEPGHVFVAFDADQIDMRAIAGHCQDPAYMELFEPGRDAHAEIAKQVFGSVAHRERAKASGHGWNYGLGINGLVGQGIPRDVAVKFDRGMRKAYPTLIMWREHVRELADRGYYLDNGFGRMMRCDPQRTFTQAPALMGQGGARDLMMEMLLTLKAADPAVSRMFKTLVHDEFLFSLPTGYVEEISELIIDAMTDIWRDVPITAGRSQVGESWGDCYR